MSRAVFKNVEDFNKIKKLEEENSKLQVALAETIEKQAEDSLNMKLAFAEIIETIMEGGA